MICFFVRINLHVILCISVSIQSEKFSGIELIGLNGVLVDLVSNNNNQCQVVSHRG